MKTSVVQFKVPWYACPWFVFSCSPRREVAVPALSALVVLSALRSIQGARADAGILRHAV